MNKALKRKFFREIKIVCTGVNKRQETEDHSSSNYICCNRSSICCKIYIYIFKANRSLEYPIYKISMNKNVRLLIFDLRF